MKYILTIPLVLSASMASACGGIRQPDCDWIHDPGGGTGNPFVGLWVIVILGILTVIFWDK